MVLMRIREAWLFFAIPLCLIPSAAVSQTGKVSLTGELRDESSNAPMSGVSIHLLGNTQEDAVPTAITDAAGRYRFLGVASGAYTIVIEVEGYLPVRQPVEELNGTASGSREIHLDIYARKAATAGMVASTDASVDVHELHVPEKARGAFNKGMSLLAKSDLSGSVAQFQRAIREYPDYYEAYAEMGVAEFHLGNSGAAEESLRKSLQLSGNKYATALFLLSDLLNRLGRFVDAEPFAEQMITNEASSARGYYEMARALDGQKRASEAEANANKAVELQPDDPNVSLLLGNIHIQEHKYAAAVHDFDRYLRLAPVGPQSDLVRKGRERIEKALYAEQTRGQSPSLP